MTASERILNRLSEALYPGKRIYRLEVVSEDGLDNTGKNRMYKCKCDCGAIARVSRPNLLRGHTKSCGCYFFDSKHNYKHGHAHFLNISTTYYTWTGMLGRCSNPKIPKYKRYGGRGITVCDRWKKFDNFLADMGEKPKGMSLDRINNDGNYEPGNCRWATQIEQQNNKGSNRRILHNGQNLTLAQWSRKLGINASTISLRLKRLGWPVERALCP